MRIAQGQLLTLRIKIATLEQAEAAISQAMPGDALARVALDFSIELKASSLTRRRKIDSIENQR